LFLWQVQAQTFVELCGVQWRLLLELAFFNSCPLSITAVVYTL